MFHRLRTVLAALMLSTVVGCLAPRPVASKLLDNTWMDGRFDWVIRIDTNPMSNYFNYPDSQLHPMVNLKTSYRIVPRLADRGTDSTLPYEDLWYHNEKPLGCKRFRRLNIKPHWQGAIYVVPSNEAEANIPAITNAMVRLLLDVSLNNNVLVAMLAPPNMVPKICDELGRYNFFRTDDNSMGAGPSGIHVVVAADEDSDPNYMVYRPPRTRR